MAILNSQQRKILEDACVKGRSASEQAVRAALTSLAVSVERPPAHLGEGDRQLRRGLRAKARQLGDQGDKLDLLVAESAYEQWHRLIFARFLAESNLLIHPDYRAPVTLVDCEELAESLGEPDGWSVAARFAAEILPGIFRNDDPCVRLRLAPEGRLSLEEIVAGLPNEIFACDDALGWIYQFWQTVNKDEINSSERKIGGTDLGPVTQLFTEDYMVRFLLENTLGAWWAARNPDSPLVKTFLYLRLNDDGSPCAGGFEGWPNRISEVTVLDPCCGSGHFLVEAFAMFWQMRAEEEGLSVASAQDLVLSDNLFGLELDSRCVQIAMFALALQAWKAGGGWRELPVPNIACSGTPAKSPVEEWTKLAKGDQRLERALFRLHNLFRDADTLGSLIDPRRTTEHAASSGVQHSFDDVDWDDIAPLLDVAAKAESVDPATAVLGAEAAGIARAANYLSRRYTLIATNVPYLTRQSQDEKLRSFLSTNYPTEALDLATAFVARSRTLARDGCTCASVMPQGWTYQPTYAELRRAWWERTKVHLIALLGTGAFGGISGEVVSVLLLIDSPGQATGELQVVDVRDIANAGAKATSLRSATPLCLEQEAQLDNPDARLITNTEFGSLPLLARYADSYYGIGTGDFPRFGRCFWEVDESPAWIFEQSTVRRTIPFGGRENVIRWDGGKGDLANYPGAFIRNTHIWGKTGVAVSLTGTLPATLYTGEAWDSNCATVIPKDSNDLPAIWAYLSSEEYSQVVRSIDQSLKVMNQTLLKVPFDAERWRSVASEAGALPGPWSDDPTQWLFEGRPEMSTDPLQVGVARLVSYRWPNQLESDDLDAYADGDGIVCLPSVAGEAPAANRLQQVLAAAFGQSWSPARQAELLEGTGSSKKNLGDWLRDDFFKQHCAFFGNRPFVWHVWDGQRDGFSALVNYHRLDRKTLNKLTYTYVGDWIERQRAELRDNVNGAEARLAAATKLRKSLELILAGDPPHDIFVRWKSLAEQPIGWEPDLNDGVRMNIRPLVEAGVLRAAFNINWKKDRGKNPDSSERINDCHFTSAEKRAARGDSA